MVGVVVGGYSKRTLEIYQQEFTISEINTKHIFFLKVICETFLEIHQKWKNSWWNSCEIYGITEKLPTEIYKGKCWIKWSIKKKVELIAKKDWGNDDNNF